MLTSEEAPYAFELLRQLLEYQPHSFSFKQGQFALIAAIFERFGRIPRFNELAPHAIHLAFLALVNRRVQVDEEPLAVLMHAIPSLGPVAIEHAQIIEEQASLILSSNNSRLIACMLGLVGNFVSTVGPPVEPIFNSTWEFIEALVGGHGLQPTYDFYPLFARSFACLLEAAKVLGRMDLRENGLALCKALMQMPYHRDNEDDVNWANSLSGGILAVYATVISWSADDQRYLGDHKGELMAPLEKIVELPRLTDELLFDFCDFMNVVLTVMGRVPRCRIAIKSQRVRRLLTWGRISMNVVLARAATELWNRVN
jgi:hypothetical protein